MKTLQIMVMCFGLLAAQAALADTNSNAVKMANGLNAPKTYTGIHPPQGKPTKSSALAPRATGGRRVYGAPIQSPIFKSQPAPKNTFRPTAGASPNAR
jgi:hypothetical protein